MTIGGPTVQTGGHVFDLKTGKINNFESLDKAVSGQYIKWCHRLSIVSLHC